MNRYWVKIGLGALFVFGVGYSAYAAGRSVFNKIKSDVDLTIPLGGLIPFNLSGQKLGTLRSLTIHRAAPGVVTGFELRTRIEDPATLEQLRNCKLSVPDPEHFGERVMFACLAKDSGYQALGEVRFDLRTGNDTQTIILPLLVPDSIAQEFHQRGGDSSVAASFGDSIAAAIRSHVRTHSQTRMESVTVDRLERGARRLQEKADSLRARAQKPLAKP